MNTSQYHKMNITFAFGRNSYEGTFYYRDNSKPIEHRDDFILDLDEIITGSMSVYNNKFYGFVINLKTVKNSENTIFIFREDKSCLPFSDKQIETIRRFDDYPFLDRKLQKKLVNPEKFSEFEPGFFDIEVVKNLETKKKVLSDLGRTDLDTAGTVKLWKNFKKLKMDEYMAISKYMSRYVISKCPYMSIETIRETPNFRFEWDILTSNLAIPIRDILNNPDLPWVYSSLKNRSDVSVEILRNKGVHCDEGDYRETNVYDHIDILMSPQEPVLFKAKYDLCFDVNARLDILKNKYPEYFDDIPSELEDRVKSVIRANIEFHGGVFNLDSFEFPEFRFSKQRRVDKCFEIPPTEDDPLGLSLAIEEIYKSHFGLFKEEASRFYEKKVGLKVQENSGSLIKNRREFIEFLKNSKKRFDIEKCVFFELEDARNFKNSFFTLYRDNDGTSVMLKSKRVTVDFFLKSNYIWFLDDLVQHLPFDFVFENLLFYPNRIKFNNIHENMSSDSDKMKVRSDLLNQDRLAMDVFCKRDDFNYDYYTQFSEVNWSKSMIENHSNPYGKQRDSSIFDNSATAALNDISWEDVKTEEGFNILLESLNAKQLWHPNMSNDSIYDLIKANNHRNIPPNFLSPDVIRKVPRVKWSLDITINLNDFLEYTKQFDVKVDMFLIYKYLISTSQESLYIFFSVVNVLKSTIIERKTGDLSKDVILYEKIVEFMPVLAKKFLMLGSSSFLSKTILNNLSSCFTREVVAASKYSDIFSIVKAMDTL